MRSAESAGLVIFVPQMVAYGGIERNLIGLSEYLTSRGLVHHIVCFYSDIDLARHAGHPVPLIELTRNPNPLVKARVLARFLAQAWRASGRKPLLFGIKGAFNMGMLQGSPFILHFTDPPSLLSGAGENLGSLRRKWLSAAADFFTRRGARRAELVITMTDRNARELHDLYGVESLVVRQGGRPPLGANSAGATGSSRLVLLSVCRLEASKRLDWIIRSVASLRAGTGPEIELVLVGRGSEQEKLATLARSLGIEPAVHFAGGVDDQELERIFARTSVFLMPAVQGYGLPALEALARRVPVVLHADSGVSEILGATPWAEVFQGEAEELTRALQRMLLRVSQKTLAESALPVLPTEAGWAEEIARHCGWFNDQPTGA